MRPAGVTILSLLFVFFGLFWMIGGIFMIESIEEIKSMYYIVEKQISELNESITPEMFETVLKVTSTVMIVSGAISTLIGIGLWKMQNWARIGAILFSGLIAISGLISAFVQPFFVLEVLLSLVVIWYLMRRDIMDAFNENRSIEERVLGEKL